MKCSTNYLAILPKKVSKVGDSEKRYKEGIGHVGGVLYRKGEVQTFYTLWRYIKLTIFLSLTLKTPIPQSGQTHSNNSSATADKLFECV